MATTSTINTGQLVQWLLEYGQRVRDIQERAWVYSHPSYVEKGLPLLYGAMQQHSQLLYGTPGGDAKAQKEFTRVLAEKAQAYIAEVQPLVSSLKIISQNFTSISQLLAELHRILGSLTLRSYPDLLHQYMDTFCGAVKAGLLLEEVPRRAAAQMVQLACAHVDKETAAPLLAAAQDAIFTAPSMVAYLQKLFRASMPRIAQVLELVVGPAMTVADNCEGVAAAGLLEMSPTPHVGGAASELDPAGGGTRVSGGGGGGEMEPSPAMGMFGMTRQQVYPFLRHREAIRQWGLLGFLVFPEILSHGGSPKRLSMLLVDGFALHVYKDRVACSHQLILQHLGPTAAAALGTGSAASNGALSPRSSGLGGLLGKGMAMIGGGVSRLRKSHSDDSDTHEQQPPHALFVDAACAAAMAAPLQHRMWRAYLIGQLRNIHAACMASPSRIPAHMEMLLAALSLSREELLWFCRHLSCEAPQELAPLMASRGALPGGQLFTPTNDDALQALQLLSAMDALHRLLVEHHSALCKQIKEVVGSDLQAHVVPCTPRVEFRLRQAAAQAAGGPAAAATAAASGPTGLQPFKDLTDLLRSVLLSSSTPQDAAARVSSGCGIWMYVSLQLASLDPPLKAAKVLQYAEDTRYLDVLQKSLDAARLLYEGPLLHASAADLAPGLQYLVEPVLSAARTALGSGRMETMQAALGAMQGLHWLLPSRSEAYAAAAAAGNAGALLSRTSAGPLTGRTSTGESAGNGGLLGAAGRSATARRTQQNVPADDLPRRCMDLVIACLRHLLAPVVQAPLANAAALNSAVRPSMAMHPRSSGSSSLMKAVIAKSKAAENGSSGSSSAAPAARSSTPERLRGGDSGAGAVPDLALGRSLVGPLHAGLEAREVVVEEPEVVATAAAAARDTVVDLVTLPSAAELAARLLPLVLALDNGRMLIANYGNDARGGDAVSVCRSQLLEALRDNFSQVLVNTAAAITKVAVPVPSLHLGPLRRFVEVVAMLQPHVATELLPELARLLLLQTSAPTLQTIGLEAAAPPVRISPAQAPPSTSAEVAASSTPNPDVGVSVGRAPSHSGISTVGAVGPMTRSLAANQSANASRNAAAGAEAERAAVGPLTAALSASSSGGASVSNSVVSSSGPTVAIVSVVRAMHAWLWSTIIQDERRQGVWYDAEAGNFAWAAADAPAFVNTGNGVVPAGLSAATGVRELSLLFEVFGPCAAADLTRGCDQLIHTSLEQLQAFMDANQGPLQDLLDSAHLPLEKRLAAVNRALPALVSSSSAAAGRGVQCLGSLADTVQRLGRCLALRIQLGRAAAASAERVADFVMLALREMATPASVSSGGTVTTGPPVAPQPERREWAALLRLTSGGSGEVDNSYGGCLLPDRDDALLTAHLASMLPGLAAAQRWHRLPALMAALMAAPQWNVGASPSGAQSGSRGKGNSTPRGSSAPAPAACSGPQTVPAAVSYLGAINTVTVSLSLSLQAAMSQALHPAASQFLLGCGTPVAAMLCAYQRIALAVTQAGPPTGSDVTAAVTAAKQQMLASLEHVPLLRNYTYTVPESADPNDLAPGEGDGAAGEGGAAGALGDSTPLSSVELGQGWWASGNNVGASINGGSGQPLAKAAAGAAGPAVHIEACELSLVEGRWSGEVDAWRPPSRLLPLVMGQVG